ncbi:MAG: hypothetical protein CMF72_24720 [Mameliella sp.]|nr:hypothetical protein [Mameliella sp.]
MSDPEIVVRGRSDLSPISRGLARVNSDVSRSGRGWSTFGRVAKVGAGVAVGAAAAAAAATYSLAAAASDLGETQQATNAIFGEQGAEALDRFAKRADTALGQSQQTALDAAGTFGTFGKAAGLAGGELVRFAKDNTRLATDLASFKNTSPEEAITAIGAAFRGESEPLRRYGVLLDDATLRQEALRLGLVKTTKDALTPQQKVLAAQSAIVKQTTDAQGDFARTSAGLANQQRILAASVENTKTKIGAVFLPALTGAVSYANTTAIPTLNKLWTAYERNGLDGVVLKIEKLTDRNGELTPILEAVRDVADDVGVIFDQAVVPALQDAATVLPVFLSPLKLASELLSFMADNADLTRVALTGLVAYLAVAKTAQIASNLAASQGISVLRNYGTTAVATGTKVGLMASKLRGAAGIAGMAALTAGATQSNDKLSLLLQTAGGAAAGGAVGGPIGALIGGAAGAASALLQMKDQTDAAAQSLDDALPPSSSFAQSLRGIAAASTKATRELGYQALQQKGLIDLADQAGVSTNALTRAYTGTTKQYEAFYLALKEVSDQEYLAEQGKITLTEEQAKQARSASELLGGLRDLRGGFIKVRAEEQAMREATRGLSKQLRSLPPRVITELQVAGEDVSLRKVARVAAKYNLTPKSIETLIKTIGVDTSVKQIQRITDKIRDAGKVEPQLEGLKQGVDKGTKVAGDQAAKGGKAISEAISKPIESTDPSLSGLRGGLTTKLNDVETSARTGGVAIGDALQGGMLSGFAGTATALANEARAAVRAAITAGRNEGKVRSPSRETFYIGDMLGRGLVDGMASGRAKAGKGGRDLVAAALSGVTAGSSGVARGISRITNLIEKQIKLKDPKKEAAREREVLRALGDQFKALERNGKAQDRIGRQLDAAVVKYRRLVSEAKAYAAQIKASFVSFGSVVGLGQNEDGSVSSVSLLDQLQDRLAQSQRFADLIRRLRRDGLNQTTIQQLLDAGVEGGLATAEALTAGGASAISQVNDLTSQIAQAGGGLGKAMAKEFKQAGIDAAEGLVKGLKQREKQLDRIADRLAQQLVKSVKKALGIQSPSRVFRGIGDNAVKGLALGLDETYVRRQGAGLAKALTTGYGSPELGAGLSAGAGSQQKVRIELDLTAATLTDLQRGYPVRVQGDAVKAIGYRTVAR